MPAESWWGASLTPSLENILPYLFLWVLLRQHPVIITDYQGMKKEQSFLIFNLENPDYQLLTFHSSLFTFYF